MSNDAFEPSLTPKIFRFSDVDHFRSSVRALKVDFTPLVRKISAEQTIFNLGGCDLNVTRSFPRIVDGQLLPDCTAVGFTLDDGVPIRFNGVDRDKSVIVIGTGGAVYTAVERVERRYASVVFTPPVEGRGWPQAPTNFNMFETSPAGQDRLRELVVEILASAPQLGDTANVRETAAAIKESLLACIDGVFADIVRPNGLPMPIRPGNSGRFRMSRRCWRAVSANRSIAKSWPGKSAYPCARCTKRFCGTAG